MEATVLDERHGVDIEKGRDGIPYFYPWYKRPVANRPSSKWPKHYYAPGGYSTYTQAYNAIARSRRMKTRGGRNG